MGNAGNANDINGLGGVSYDYHIGTHEVTNAQYTSFLNSVASSDPNGLWNSSMGSNARGGISRSGTDGSFTYSTRANMANKPVNFVSFWDAARFTNWLTSGDTETGVYVLTPSGIANNTITRDAAAWDAGGVGIASENEWYKAAYYDPTLNGGSGGYWLYPTQSDTAPTEATANSTGDVSNPGANVANFNSGADWNSQNGNVTTVGSVGAANHYGTFDQGGNVFEWNDEIVFTTTRGARGGAFDFGVGLLPSTSRSNLDPAEDRNNIGFRVTSRAPIPEPSAYAALLGCLGLGLALMRRKERV